MEVDLRSRARWMTYLVMLGILGTIHAASTTPPQTTTTAEVKVNGGVCNNDDYTDDDVIQRVSILYDLFKASQVDLIFILDRSKSIGPLGFEESVQTVLGLVSSLATSGRLFFHQAHARAALISFGSFSNVDFEKLSSTIDVCLLTTELQRVGVPDFSDRSKVVEAMSRASSLFADSRVEMASRRQVIWLFTDGEWPEQDRADGKTMTEWVEQLRKDGVTIFVAAVGEWLDLPSELERLKNHADTNDHFACAKSWRTKIFTRIEKEENKDMEREYSEISDLYNFRCGECPDQGEQCACYATNHTYLCTDKPVLPLDYCVPPCTTTTTTAGPGVPLTAPPAVSGPNSSPGINWYLYGGAGGGGLLVIILIIVIIAMTCKHRRERRRWHYSGSLANPRIQIGDRIYDTAMNAYNEEPKNAPSLHKNMDGWAACLTDAKEDYHIDHIAVRSLSENKWVHTDGCNISEREFRQIGKALDGKLTENLVVSGKTFKIGDRRSTRLHATEVELTADPRVLIAYRVYDYVVVGIARQTVENECEQAICDIYNHLYKKVSEDSENLSGDRHNDDHDYLTPRDYGTVGVM